MKWLRTPNGGYVDPLEIDDTPDRVWHAVMDARRNA